jgi:hypothetical protein
MTINHKNTDYHFTFLPNGIARTFDHGASWDVAFKKDGDKWIPHNFQAGLPAYRGLADKLNNV